MKPRLSVIMPAHQAADLLPRSLAALTASTLPRNEWELIVVDDASSDDTSIVAAGYADTVVRLPSRSHGPAYARNRGFEAARSDVVVFVDADVCVHPETLERFCDLFAARPDVAAVFGSYGTSTLHGTIVSEFRNLLHHHVHQRSAGEAETFWAGCGAVRSSVFRAVGMFDEWHYARPQIEDVELGRRLRLGGHRILLRPEIQCTHLKRWTLRTVMTTDLKHRGVPWTRLLLHEGPSAGRGALNLRVSEKLCTVFAGGGWLAITVALLMRSAIPLLYLPVAIMLIAVLNRDFYRFVGRERGVRVAVAMLPLHVLYYGINVVAALVGWSLHVMLGEPQAPLTAAAAVGMELRTWPPRPSPPAAGVWSRPRFRRSAAARRRADVAAKGV